MIRLLKILRFIYLIPVYLYKGILSPYIGGSCIYSPTCSTYFSQAVSKHGILKGTVLGVIRIARCSKFYIGGYDPVPETFSFEEIKKNNIIFKRRKEK
ncbi:MAG: membrane protein insertion efficiency factor YidD [Sphaerochaetaceae bacterium]|nr:membrane protein insertion efficiency factor YidD [Sphaerochaetaceae bacterium]